MRGGMLNTIESPKRLRSGPGSATLWSVLICLSLIAVRQASALTPEQLRARLLRAESGEPAVREEERTLGAQAEVLPPERPSVALDRIIDRTTYRLGPGDRLVLNLWGTTNRSFELEVTPEGDMLIPAVGPVHVADSTLAEAESLVVVAAQQVYEKARLTLSLSALRTFRIHVSGHVVRPGSHLATVADRVSTVIENAGGLEDDASLRRIRLDRRHTPERLVDLEW